MELDTTKQQESLLEPPQSDLSFIGYQHNANLGHEQNSATSLFTSYSEYNAANHEGQQQTPTAFPLISNNWYTCPSCGTELEYCNSCISLYGITAQLPSAANSNHQYKADLKQEQVLTISPHMLHLNGAADYEGQKAHLPIPNGPLPSSISSSKRKHEADLKQEQVPTISPHMLHLNGAADYEGQKAHLPMPNGPLPSSISSSKRKHDADLEQEQNSPKKRAYNDKTYTSSVNDGILNLGRQTGLPIPDDFEFSRENSTKNKPMSKKGILQHALGWVAAVRTDLQCEKEIAAKLRERIKQLENNNRILQEAFNTFNENINSTKAIRSSIKDG